VTGLNVEDVDVDARRIRVRRSITQVGGRLVEGNPKSDACRRSVPIPERLVPAPKARLDGHLPGAPAITSPRGSRLRLENWKRAVNWKAVIAKVGRETLRVHDLRHTYASLSRRAGADLFDDELDNIGAALDSLDDLSQATWRPVGAPWGVKIRRWSPVVLGSGAAGSFWVFVVVVPGKTLVP
jgi:integrase